MKRILLLVLFFLPISGYAQDIILTEGSLSFLKEETTLNTKFTYDSMLVENYKSEEEFVQFKRDKFNSKLSGSGDVWEFNWTQDRNKRYEPAFRLLFEKHSKFSTVDPQSKYTMVIHTVYLDTGLRTITWAIPSFFISLDVTIVETKNPSTILSKMRMIRCPAKIGYAFLYDTGECLQEGYAKAGKELGKFLKRRISM